MDRKQIDNLLKLPLIELIAEANRLRKRFVKGKIDLCSILNAKSGSCAEDCKFCAQSARHRTQAPVYGLKNKAQILEAAVQAKKMGAKRFGIVTSGDALCASELSLILDTIKEITGTLKIRTCASLGSMGEKEFFLLKKAGLGRYHHNIETSPGFFPKIVSTHTFEDRIKTIKAAKSAGLEVCSGGIIGMGESMDDRVQMALVLNDLKVDSVPLNLLVPIKGTPLAKITPLSCREAIRTIAIFRIILKDKTVKIAAGRESVLKDFQALGFMAGANGMLVGGYLTVMGRTIEEDKMLVKEIEQLWKA